MRGDTLDIRKSNFHLHLSGCKEGLQALQHLADQACEGVCLNAIQINRIALALDELFANIHAHGYANQGGDIDCSAKWTGQEGKPCLLEIKLRDYAPAIQDITTCKGIDPETLKDHPVAGGLGLHLIYAITESFEHTPLEDGNQWCLLFNLKEEDTKT
ncbi:MAG: ATP-binding protein [Ghiorsea sp.]|nr:ATP-binding protein [Ghiorsea sp.]MDQ6980686.1 ATP-binding protein [Ghiorsea sp.]MDQ7058585.1 ATP-binding protein [Ghiorsea sp.]